MQCRSCDTINNSVINDSPYHITPSMNLLCSRDTSSDDGAQFRHCYVIFSYPVSRNSNIIVLSPMLKNFHTQVFSSFVAKVFEIWPQWFSSLRKSFIVIEHGNMGFPEKLVHHDTEFSCTLQDENIHGM